MPPIGPRQDGSASGPVLSSCHRSGGRHTSDRGPLSHDRSNYSSAISKSEVGLLPVEMTKPTLSPDTMRDLTPARGIGALASGDIENRRVFVEDFLLENAVEGNAGLWPVAFRPTRNGRPWPASRM
jgi:hypothetical protein